MSSWVLDLYIVKWKNLNLKFCYARNSQSDGASKYYALNLIEIGRVSAELGISLKSDRRHAQSDLDTTSISRNELINWTLIHIIKFNFIRLLWI